MAFVLYNSYGVFEPKFWRALIAWFAPFTYGREYSLSYLNAHLWFIPPYLIVTLTLPLLAKFTSRSLIFWLFAISIFILSIYTKEPTVEKIITPLFYLFWALAGYSLANTGKVNKQIYLFTIGFGLMTITVLKLTFDVTLNIHAHKFPPNYMFFIFSVIWVSVFLLFIQHIPPGTLNNLSGSKLFKPFIKYGYSIYIWQGFGYSLALFINSKIGIPRLLIWFLAIIFTVALKDIQLFRSN